MVIRLPVGEGIVVAGVVVLVGLIGLSRGPMSIALIALAVTTGFGLAAGVWSFVASKRKWHAEFGDRDRATYG
jgi:hypothetical protein